LILDIIPISSFADLFKSIDYPRVNFFLTADSYGLIPSAARSSDDALSLILNALLRVFSMVLRFAL